MGESVRPKAEGVYPGNQESAQAKVNDADGNPIEIAAVVVWQVLDTAMALYSVDDFTQFVTIHRDRSAAHRLLLPLRQTVKRESD